MGIMHKKNIVYFILLFSLLTGSSVARVKTNESAINFSSEEKEWIRNHPVIRVANETDWPPFDFNESGEAKGLGIDHIKLLANKIGIKIDFVYGLTWTGLVEQFKQRKIDVMPVFYVNEPRKSFTLYTRPYYRGKLGIFTMTGDENRSFNLLDKRVGMQASHGSLPLLKQKIPGIIIKEFDSELELVKKLATNQLDVIIGNPFVFYYIARENQINNIQLSDFVIMSEEEQQDTSLHIGVRNDWPILQQILQKTMESVTEEEMNKLQNKWANVTIYSKTDWVLVGEISGAVAIIALLLLWHNRKLKTVVYELQKTKEMLQNQANTDPLTGLFNRRYFIKRSTNEFIRSKHYAVNMSLLMIDVDFFKPVNDTYGHAVGDAVLIRIAENLQASVRQNDILSRIGGEEFAIVLPHTSIAEGAQEVAERIRRSQSEMVIKGDWPGEIKVTLSIGMTEICASDEEFKMLLSRADNALYQAKNAGRNCIQIG